MKEHTHKDGKFYYGGDEVSIEDMLVRLNLLERQNTILCADVPVPWSFEWCKDLKDGFAENERLIEFIRKQPT